MEQFDTHFALIYAKNEDSGLLEVRLHFSRCDEVENYFIAQSALIDPEVTLTILRNFSQFC